MKRVMILIVAYNAERTINRLLDRIPKKIWDNVEEIVVADDSSKDRTSEVSIDYKRFNKKPNLTIMRHKKNKGYGGNQKWGYNYAIKKGYDIVVMLHGDIQYAPEDIDRLLVPLESGKCDMVFGSRMAADPLGGGMPLYKFIGNKILTFIENKILGLNLSEYHSGFRLYSCAALKKIPLNLCSDNFHFDSEIMIQFKIAKLRIKELPIQTYYGDEVCYVNVLEYGINILKELGKYGLSKLISIKKYDKKHYNL